MSAQASLIQQFLKYKSSRDDHKATYSLNPSQVHEFMRNREDVLRLTVSSLNKTYEEEAKPPSEVTTAEEPSTIFADRMADEDEPESKMVFVGDEQTGYIEVELFSKDDILVKTSMFVSGRLKEAIQACAGVFLIEQNGFLIPIQLYQDFKERIVPFKGIKLRDVPEFVVRALAQRNPVPCKKCPTDFRGERIRSFDDIPVSFTNNLYPFQRDGVIFALEHHGRVLIGDEMGVGKTIQGIATACAFRDEWPVFVLCPASVKLNWREEFMRWYPELEKKDFYLLHSKKSMKNAAKIWIASYNMATLLEQWLNTFEFKVVIADESHYMKNFKAKRTQALIPILQRAKRVILLSGTPVLARPAELFTQLAAIRPDIFANFKQFADRFCDPKVMFTHTDYTGAAHIKELHTVLSNTVMIRRLKSDVLRQLPAKVRQKVEIAVNAAHCRKIKKLYFEIKKKQEYFQEVVQNLGTEEAEQAIRKLGVDMFISRAYSLTALAKQQGVCEYVSYLVQNDCKFIVFGHHLDMLDAIENQVIKEKAKYIRIDGSTPQERRQQGILAFQKYPDCKVAVLGILAAGQGITLTAASTVIMAEMNWTPGVMIQAEDRAHRIGQEKCVNIHYLFGPGTLDEYIWPKLQKKLSVIAGTLDNYQNRQLDGLFNPELKIGMGDFEGAEGFDFELPESDEDNYLEEEEKEGQAKPGKKKAQTEAIEDDSLDFQPPSDDEGM
jgi:SWI/SNF-related matrix-associated actin-dependent regulator 1 of chromatin subfamily A